MKELVFSDDEDEVVSGVEVDSSKIKSVKYEGDSWINRELDPIKLPLVCRIPNDVLISMRTIERLMCSNGMGSQEFGVFLKGQLSPEGVLIVESDLYVPKQKVSGATIDFEEDTPSGFNGVIHRHPGGCKNFSGTDSSYINKNFEFSLLYVDNEINIGIINLVYKNGLRLQLPVSVSVMYPIFNGFDNVLEKIELKKYPQTKLGDDFVTKHDVRGYLPGLSIEDDEDRLRFPPDESDTEDDSKEEEGDGVLDSKMYQCKICGETQEIDHFPHDCEGCDQELDQTMVEFIDDLEEIPG